MAIMHTLFFSNILKRRCAMNVYVPETPHKDGKPGFPVVYLLHGRSDDENSYADHGIRPLCEKYQFIAVMPDGDRSFYCDMHSGEKYWTFISEELPRLISVMFPARTDRANTFAAGLSMGGYGALKIGLTYPERYAGVAAFSAVTDIVGFVERMKANAGYWNAIFGGVEGLENSPHDLFYLAKKAKDEAKPLPRMYLWCGTEDSLLSHTERMRDCLLSLGYPLRHSLTQGNHSWPYWDEQSEKAISYFTEQ